MKSLLIFVLVLGLAFGKSFEELYNELEDVEEFQDPRGGQKGRPTGMPNGRPTGMPNGRPTGMPNGRPTGMPFGRPTDSLNDQKGSANPTGSPKRNVFERFLNFLLVKSVRGVKPDEHPDRKYQQPGEELVDELLKVRKAVLGAFKPLKDILRLMKEDHKEMMRRVRLAVSEQNIGNATHIVGEYFIAIQRRMAMLVIHAAQKGLFEEVKDAGVDPKAIKRELQDHADEAHAAAKYILENFSEYRVSDGLMDGPFVKLGIVTHEVMERAKNQVEKVVKIYSRVYVDMISQMVTLSMDFHNHEAAVLRAGSGVLSFMRRGTKTGIALYQLQEAKQCRKGDKDDRKDGDKDDRKDGDKDDRKDADDMDF